VTRWRWLAPDAVAAIHEAQLAEHGGRAGSRDAGLLLSALGRARNLAEHGEADHADLAAAYGFGIVRDHPFVDGNKRTAHVAYRTFLELNGADLVATDEEKYVSILALAEGKLSERDFAAWLRGRLRTAARGEVHEPRRAYRARRAAGK
jgi:death-on-curing protein